MVEVNSIIDKTKSALFNVYNEILLDGINVTSEKVKNYFLSSTYEILQIVGISLLGKTAVNKFFINKNYKSVKELFSKQMTISWI